MFNRGIKDHSVVTLAMLPVHKAFEAKIGRDLIQAAYRVATEVEKEGKAKPSQAKPSQAKQ